MWESAGVRARRGSLRVLLAGSVVALAVTGLAGCRTSPTVAAYVGNRTISVDTLDAAVTSREGADKTVAAYAKAHPAAFTRQVLTFLVTDDVYDAVSDRYHVRVSDDAVRARITTLLGGNDPSQVYGQLAAQGITRGDVFDNVRQQLVRQQVAGKAGLAGPLSESALQARYQQVRGSLAERQFGYITVPDQATAGGVLAQLTANPAAYPTVAAQYPGQYTLPAQQPTTADQVPSTLATGFATAAPNTGYTVPVPQVGVVVVFVGDTVYPEYAQVRGQLQQEAESAVDTKAQQLVDTIRTKLPVTINPRYGALQKGGVTEPSGGVVDILGSASSSSSSAAAPPAGSGSAGG